MISRQKHQQAQHMIAVPVPKSIDNLTLTLRQTVNTDAHKVRGCTILPDGRMMFTCFKRHKVIAINNDGTKDFEMKLDRCFDIDYIDNNIMFVTSDPDNNTVTCIDFQGMIQWEFKEESVLKCPQGISVDNDGNVYVVGAKSNTVVVISHDGKRHRQLLSSKEGLSYPYALHYDQSTNSLLVANDQDHAFFFSSRLEKKHSCKESSDKEIDDAAKDWRRLSLDREGGKKQRREKKNNNYK
ncbi:unnamed protein product [Mytilus edulis]|uniref:Uncharacterized protein n=1 Tax=Mytilus edulis TaxID=6550 RepID=A0A8S3T6S8_MYTED|nr:unnamed protein product [Mytilus edulis]